MQRSSPRVLLLTLAAIAAVHGAAAAQNLVQGPSSSQTPYLVPTAPGNAVRAIVSLITTTDLVPLTGSPTATYEFGGIPDGVGAYDNGDGTVTVLLNHELGTTNGVVRAHGAAGTYVEQMVLDVNTLAVVSSQDLMRVVIDENGVAHSAAGNNGLALNRFCSADLPAPTAFYNAASGLGTVERVFLNGEEGGANGRAMAHVATGATAGTSYVLPLFNLSTNGSGLTGVGAWENLLACPFAQDMTIVIGTNDGGTGIMNGSVACYLGTKTATGTEADKAGLTNGVQFFVNVVGNPVEIVDAATRATHIADGTRFYLSTTSSTVFSRPEDGAWNPANPREFYFNTTDRLDTATATGTNPTLGSTGTANQVGMSRVWRLTFDDLANPQLGGRIDLMIDGAKGDQKVQMLDNLAVGANGRVYLNEDPGNSTYIGKVWSYDPATDTLVQLAKFDPARWGDLAINGGTPGGIAPQTNDKESSAIVDVTHLFPHAADEVVLLTTAQDHSTNPLVATPSSVEGGQLLLLRVALDAAASTYGQGCGNLQLAAANQPTLGEWLIADVTGLQIGAPALMMVGLSNTDWFGAPLPLPLDGLGLTGCSLYTDLAIDVAGFCAATGATSARHVLPIPATHSVIGFAFYLQAWSANANANPAGLVTSNGLALHVGI